VAFVAITVNVYAVPLVSPVTVMGLAAPFAVILPGVEVTVYPVIADPPLLVGAVNVTVARAFPAVAVPIVGAPGPVEGVTEFEGELGKLLPVAFVAITVKVYAVPLVSPVTVIGLVEPVPVILPGVEVAVYPVIADPPLLAGAVNVTIACALPAVAIPIVGVPGTVEGVTEFEAALAGLFPLAFVAITVKVYAVPLVSPVTIMGLAAPFAVILPGVEVTMYPVIPELSAGAVKVIVAWAFPAVATTFVGAFSIVVNEISAP
jgi:hypothetical protein